MIDTLYIRTNKNFYCPSYLNPFPITGKHTWFRQIKSTIVYTVYIIIKKQRTHSRVFGTLENKIMQLICGVLLAPPLHVYISTTNRRTESHNSLANFTIFRRFWVARTGFYFPKSVKPLGKVSIPIFRGIYIRKGPDRSSMDFMSWTLLFTSKHSDLEINALCRTSSFTE